MPVSLIIRTIFIFVIDSISSHLVLYLFLFAIADSRIRWKAVGRMMLISVSLTTLAAWFLYYMVSIHILLSYALSSLVTIGLNVILITVYLKWHPLKSLTALALAAAMQVGTGAIFASIISGVSIAESAGLVKYIFWMVIVYPAVVFAICLLLTRLQLGRYMRFLLSDEKSLVFTASAALVLEIFVELLFTMKDVFQANFNFTYILSILTFLLLILCFFTYISAKGERDSKIRMQEAMLLEQRHYMENLEAIQKEMRAFRHDYKNILSGMSVYAEEGNTQEIKNALRKMEADFDYKVGENIRQAGQLGNIQIPELKSLVLSKLSRMKEKQIVCNLEVFRPVTEVSMDVLDLNRCLGILLDNAIEAADITEGSSVDLIISRQEDMVTIIVSNPWNKELALHSIWKEGYSTKGEGRGLGLPGYQRILGKYENVFPVTSWKNHIFTQEIKIMNKG